MTQDGRDGSGTAALSPVLTTVLVVVVRLKFWRQHAAARLPCFFHADKDAFSIAVEELTYEGPLRLQVIVCSTAAADD